MDINNNSGGVNYDQITPGQAQKIAQLCLSRRLIINRKSPCTNPLRLGHSDVQISGIKKNGTAVQIEYSRTSTTGFPFLRRLMGKSNYKEKSIVLGSDGGFLKSWDRIKDIESDIEIEFPELTIPEAKYFLENKNNKSRQEALKDLISYSITQIGEGHLNNKTLQTARANHTRHLIKHLETVEEQEEAEKELVKKLTEIKSALEGKRKKRAPGVKADEANISGELATRLDTEIEQAAHKKNISRYEGIRVKNPCVSGGGTESYTLFGSQSRSRHPGPMDGERKSDAGETFTSNSSKKEKTAKRVQFDISLNNVYLI